jgi:hypothetical protein
LAIQEEQMAQLNVKLSTEQIEALRGFAARRRTPVSWLIKDYIDYLLSGGQPVRPPPDDALHTSELTSLAQWGGALDWLATEPDLYSPEDAEPV